ncbi:DUF2267 domain-containing protein [Hyalangium rubrum]|uniref:DUF2267 domain-containing protein n=1 Tax=Hyalangium rubrum TaxID=3103134 RepID=A0ABU5GZT5_9BACT|nr:DUF2267 domain-containing protein [Hyalangium sp. s54d21]MDY7226546.1 DUF2267 domain-containing protein [Hyalangium sp. s54d21]
MQDVETQSWSGLGVGTDRQSFLQKVTEQLPDYEPALAVEAVFCALTERLPGGIVQQLLEQLSPDVRELVGRCQKRGDAPEKLDRDDFYLHVANHLNADIENVRLVLHGVFAALHSQITEAESEKVVSQLPDYIKGTWLAARRGVDKPY